MTDLHPTQTELEDFMLGRLSQRESRRVILHLLPGCRRCQEVTSALWDVGTEVREESRPVSERFRYDDTLERVFDRIRSSHAGLEAERADARRRLAKLEKLPAARWLAAVQADRRYHTWGFCELLLERCRVSQEPEVCADLAVAVAGRIDAALHPRVFLEDLQARAWTELTDVRRNAGDLGGAEEALRQAELHLLRGTGERLERARLLERKAALRAAQDRSEDAARLLSRAILLYRRAGQWERVARILIGLGCLQATTAGRFTSRLGR
jgi:hypothetical protein